MLKTIARVLGRATPSPPAPPAAAEPTATTEATALMAAFIEEWRQGGARWWGVDPTAFPSGCALLDSPDGVRVAAVFLAVQRLLDRDSAIDAQRHHLWSTYAVEALLNRLLRRRLPLTGDQVVALVDRLAGSPFRRSGVVSVPLLLRCVERALGPDVTAPGVRAALERLRDALVARASEPDRGTDLAALDALLGAPLRVERLLDSGDEWGERALIDLEAMDPADRQRWTSLLAFAATATSAKPSPAWLKRARSQIADLGHEEAHATALAWLRLLLAPGRNERRENPLGFATTSAAMVEPNATTLKGLAWCCALDGSPETARALADAAEACFKKLPGVQCRSLKVGTACVQALGAMEGTEGVTQLQRLRGRVKLKTALKTLDAVLDEAARRAGTTREDLDDLAVPTFDLVDGRRRWEVDGFTAELVVAGARGVEQRWSGPDGAPRKSVPAALKRDHAAELKAIKQTAADIEKALAAQATRLERLFLAERSWSLTDWRARYLDHPFLSLIARRLIWRFEDDGRVELGSWRDGRLVGADDRPLDWPAEMTRVRLWHPIESDAATVEAWQRWLERHEITQPFKQAHREVYVLTDAELQTRTYSNRFAAHVLRQHQFHALCSQRGWSFRLLGWWDGWNEPTLELPRWNLRVSFRVDGVGEGDDTERTEAYACLRVATDQVRFDRPNGERGVPLEEVPPLVFSEVMRNVDLFVGVCSVGNDPTWQDGGPDRYRAYWHDYSFGDLSATAQTRRAVLARLLPRLKIASRCSLDEKFLVVRGDLRTYRIHLGSGNILMEPNNQYLCIVPNRGGDAPNVFLPFEGDNQLSIILSKAFLLAADKAIKDPTITRQLR